MDATKAAAKADARLLDIGVFQWISLGFTALLGGFIAYNKGAWCTFGGAAAGVLFSIFLPYVAKYTVFHPAVCAYFANLSARNFLRVHSLAKHILKADSYEIFSRIAALWRKLWGILGSQNPTISHRLVLCGLCKSPTKYGGWFMIGVMMHTILSSAHLANGRITLSELPLRLDLAIGVFVLLTALRDTFQDMERSAFSRAQEIVPAALAEKLLAIRKLAGLTEHDSTQRLAGLREDVMKRRYQIGQFTTNGSLFLEGCFNLVVLLIVLLIISPYGGLLALFAVISMIPIRAHDLLTVKAAEDDVIVSRAELASMERLSVDTRTQDLLHSIADPNVLAGYLKDKRELIFGVQENMRLAGSQRRAVGRMVFFTLFALSAIYPVLSASGGVLYSRYAMLYFFSLLGVWSALSLTADRAFRLVQGLDDLSTVEEAVGVLSEVELNIASADSIPALTNGALSSNVEFCETHFNYPFRDILVRSVSPITTGKTITTAQVVKVVGQPGTGSSTVLKLIAGHLKPTMGSVSIGGVCTSDQDMAPWAKLVSEQPPEFSGLKIGEIFRAVCGPEFFDGSCVVSGDPNDLNKIERARNRRIERILDDFGLLKDIKITGNEDFSGANFMIGYQGRHLSLEQKRLLFLALNYAALKSRLTDTQNFHPAVVLVDGISKLALAERRRAVEKLFVNLCNEYHATLVCVAHPGDLEDDDFVLSIIEPPDLPPDYAIQGDGNVLIGALHRGRWNNPDLLKRTQYRSWLTSVRQKL